MKLVKTKGIVISESNMGDYDKMLTILTPDLGKISCAAKGSRRPKSLLMSGSQFLCFSEYVLYKATNSYIMNSCQTIEMFYDIRTDLDKLNYAATITKIINDVTYENESSYNILKLLLNTIYIINTSDKNLNLIMSTFKIKLLSIIGFMPEIQKCTCAQNDNLNYFSIKDNGLKCNVCGKQDKSAIQIKDETRLAIQYIICSESKKIFSFTIPDDAIKELDIISKLYLAEKLEKNYKL